MNDKILLETCLNHIAVILMEVQWKLMIEHVFPSIVFGGFVTWLYTQSRARIFFVPSNQSEREDIFLSKSNDSRRSKVKSQYNLITIKVSVARDLCNQNELIKQEKHELEKNTETRPYIRHIKFPRRIWCVCVCSASCFVTFYVINYLVLQSSCKSFPITEQIEWFALYCIALDCIPRRVYSKV